MCAQGDLQLFQLSESCRLVLMGADFHQLEKTWNNTPNFHFPSLQHDPFPSHDTITHYLDSTFIVNVTALTQNRSVCFRLHEDADRVLRIIESSK